MKPLYAGILGLSALAACGTTNPLGYAPGRSGGGGGAVVDGDVVPAGAAGIKETSNPYTTQTVTLNANGTLTVVGLPFDGNDAYANSGIQLGPNVARPRMIAFKADPTMIDDAYDGGADGPINQDDYIAVRGQSSTGRTRVAVVRSGAYENYGFGGYLIERDVGATLPTTGQANYTGNYAGVRVFNGAGGIELVDGDMLVEVDFANLSDNGALRGSIENRILYDSDRNVISDLPDVVWYVEPNNIGNNAHIDGRLYTEYAATYTDSRSPEIISKDGRYSALFVGPNAEELVGVVVLETSGYMTQSGTTTIDGTTYNAYEVLDENISSTQETGGFVLER